MIIILRKFTALILFTALTVCASNAYTQAAPAKTGLSDSMKQELNKFFQSFCQLLSDDYNIDEYEKSNDALIAYAIWYAYQNNAVQTNTGREDFKAYVSRDYIDDLLLKFFGVNNVRHHSFPSEYEWASVDYENNGYYFTPADGAGFRIPQIIELYDNGNGTLSAIIETYQSGHSVPENWYEDKIKWKPNPYADYLPEREVGYKIAIIQPYSDNGNQTYRLLYWKSGNDVNISGDADIISKDFAINMKFKIDDVNYTKNDNLCTNDVAPFISNEGRTMVPIRVIAEAFGAEVKWEGTTQTATINKNGVALKLTVDVPLPDNMGTPVISNGRAFVPLRYIAERLGAEVEWVGKSQEIYIVQK